MYICTYVHTVCTYCVSYNMEVHMYVHTYSHTFWVLVINAVPEVEVSALNEVQPYFVLCPPSCF